MRRALLAGLVTTAVGAAGVVLSGAASGEPARTGPAAAPAGTKTVTYGAFRFQVPASWPVYDLAHDPGRCVRFDMHAVYLGKPGPDQVCPARPRGRTDAVLVQPLDGAADAPSVRHLSAPDPKMAVKESVARQQRVAIREAHVQLTVTYGERQSEAQRIIRSGHIVHQAAPARPSAPSPSAPGPSSGSPAVVPPATPKSGTASPAAGKMSPVAERQPLRASAPFAPPQWVLGWSQAYGLGWYAMPGASTAPKRAVPQAAAPRRAVPRPAPAPAPQDQAARPVAARPKPAPAVTVTKTVLVPPPGSPSSPKATPTSPSHSASASPSASPTDTKKDSPLPKPTVSYSASPSPSGKSETSKKKTQEKKYSASRLTGRGFDTCTAPSVKTMRAWRGSYQAANIYIGGAARACGDGNLSKSWVKSVRKAGWRLIPTYVGLQAPCSSYGSKIDPNKARSQGKQSADDAISDAKSFGLPKKAPLYFDMEGYNNGKAWCKSAVLKFLDGWTDRLHQRGRVSGVYGSVSSTIVDLGRTTGGTMPDGVWFAHWDGKANTTSPYMSGKWWPNRQRIKQYRGTHNEKHGGVSMSVDSNRVDGYVY